jgi:hypothetical protein
LNVDDDFGLSEATGKPLVFLAEFLVLRMERSTDGFLAPALLGYEGGKDAAVALTSPRGEIGGIEPLAAQKLPKTPRLIAGIGKRKDPTLVFSRKPAPRGFSRNLGIRWGRRCPWRHLTSFGVPPQGISVALRAPSLPWVALIFALS